jgi:AmmeMemoRadiSam system protein B
MGKVMPISTKIRQPAVGGLFYPEKKATLDQELAYLLEEARDVNLPGQIIGLIVPHAGYSYSGGVAARAYRQIIDLDIDTVVVIAPSHCEYFTEISIYDGYAYTTPLGSILVDQELARHLSEKGHRFDEHALEVQLPFLQKVLQDFRLLPIVMGEHSQENIAVLSAALAQVLNKKKALIIASSDLSHFYQADKAQELDQVVIEHLDAFDEDQLFKDLQNGKCEMCGGGPAIAAMKTLKLLGADRSKVLLYRNSGDITGDQTEVVGYLSAVFYKSEIS